ncbi:MAG: helix-hairpin-helix domain-containing protein [Chloroflexi bacterium]|nr:MAG: helix-hairpin-helix domain-containing protein [Chloroflexota bacterium]
MKEKHSFNFLVGVIIGVLVAMLVWYWQKSTRAEDGALALLDRLKDAEQKVREVSVELVRGETAVSLTPPPADDLQQVKGIGPVFADRLQSENITTFTGLIGLTADQLAEILGIRLGRAETILIEAKQVA